jgi:hypothetical protein
VHGFQYVVFDEKKMVYFVLTRSGFEELISLQNRVPSPIWVNDGVLTPTELLDLRNSGVEVTNFVRLIDPEDMSAINEAIYTVQEHCPGKTIWVERAP